MSHPRLGLRSLTPLLVVAALALSPNLFSVAHAAGAEVPVEEFELSNGMRFLVVERPERTTVSAAWVAHVGSANERPGITGISHFFEHMMFKGTSTVGTKNAERDREIIAEQEELQEQIREIYRKQRERWRLGEIEDPFDAEYRTPEQIELEKRFAALIEEQRELMVKNEFDKIYTESGATGMNAFTNRDVTGYFITVPANKLELWFWMESDRLADPIFREFYSERDVVYEERRLRTESTPTGKFDEQFESMFWQSHPYGWPVVGWPSDIRVYTLEQAQDYYDTYYAANNLTAILVGNFKTADVKAMAEKYFGRLERSKRPIPDVVTLEMDQLAEKRMVAECDCQPQVAVRYHTVPFRHADSYALDVLSGLMTGQTGRLYKSLVLDKGIASGASAGQNSMKYGGSFTFSADTKGDATPSQLEEAWYAELQRIIDEPIPVDELQKVKNQIAADAYRRLENPFFLAIQLLIYDGMGDWTYLNTWSERTLAVTAEDVKRVAQSYLTADNRAVAQYFREEGSTEAVMPDGFAELPAQQQQMVKQQLNQLKAVTDAEQLRGILAQVDQQSAQVPAEMQKMIQVLKNAVQDRLNELEEGQ